MHSSVHPYDSVEQLIHDEKLTIKTVEIGSTRDFLRIILNNGKHFEIDISRFPRLSTQGNPEALLHYRLVAGGTGLHWPELDEDLSLKGMLKEVLRQQIV